MVNAKHVAELLKSSASILQGESSYRELGAVCEAGKIEEAFAACRAGLNALTEMERFDVWHHARSLRDRMAGILCVAEFRIPPLAMLGPLTLSNGNSLTDYDRARTFILQNRPAGEFIPNFYPEVARLPPRERIIALATAHIGCTPAGQRQTNLFALCGYNDWNYARSTTTPSGTTCGLFMRAILKAAGDTRLTAEMLPRIQTDMHKAMGLAAGVVSAGTPPFCSGIKPQVELPTPKRGDLYHTQIPSVALKGQKQDAGHVGFVVSVSRTSQGVLEIDTIDGGVIGASGKGFHTVAEKLKLVRNGQGYWETQNKLPVKDEKRILVGFVDIDQTASSFIKDRSFSLDGRYIDTQYPG